MPRRFDLLVFDWDGTLMDSTAAIAQSLRLACADLRLTVPSDEKARYVIGLGLDDALHHLLPDYPRSGYPALLERYRHHFLNRDGGTLLFAGIGDALRDMHAAGFQLAVATGKSRNGLERAFQASAIRHYFHATRCADESRSKPHPEMLLWLLAELKVPADRALMIGDTSHDMAMAQAAGVARLAVTYGAHPRGELLAHQPLACIDTVEDLAAWLKLHA